MFIGRKANYLFLESVVAAFHLVALEANKSNSIESRNKEDSTDKAPTMKASTGRWSWGDAAAAWR